MQDSFILDATKRVVQALCWEEHVDICEAEEEEVPQQLRALIRTVLHAMQDRYPLQETARAEWEDDIDVALKEVLNAVRLDRKGT